MAIARINFIEREPFRVTYRKMVVIGSGVFGILLLVAGFQSARTTLLTRKALRLTTEIQALRVEREKILERAAEDSDGGMAFARLKIREPFVKAPQWSGILRTLAQEMPASVWLVSLKSYDKPESPSGKGVILVGEARAASEVSSFLKALSRSREVQNVILTSSTQERGPMGRIRYHFTIDAWLAPGGRA